MIYVKRLFMKNYEVLTMKQDLYPEQSEKSAVLNRNKKPVAIKRPAKIIN